MSDTYGNAFFHVVFSTKKRYPWLVTDDHQKRCWKYMEAIAREKGGTPIIFGGMPDHMHLLFDLPPALSLSDMVKNIKGSSSVWVKRELSDCGGFGWQAGYAYFPVSVSIIDRVKEYIANQKHHHKNISYEDEYRILLQKNKVAFKEADLWKD
jgi:REP element-mobilizing transposase RayT